MNRDKNKIAFDARLSMRHIDDNGYLHVALTPISKACVNPYLGRELPGWEEPEKFGNKKRSSNSS